MAEAAFAFAGLSLGFTLGWITCALFVGPR
jgi:hypothetical protein